MKAADFETLDRALPLALLPVRVEARYLPHGSPTHLCIRIFPDVIHANAHHAALTTRERDAGRQYWTTIWASADAVVIADARNWLASQSTPYRALWIATATAPTNLDTPTDPGPVFADVLVDDVPGSVTAALLPSAFMVRLYDSGGNLVHTAFTSKVSDPLTMAPTLTSTGIDATHPVTGDPLPAPLALLAGQDLLWTVDFEQAVAVGMGLRIPVDSVPDPVAVLLVLGARLGLDPLEEAAAMDDVLLGHWYTRGLDVSPQGTPTNNTDAGRSGVSLSAPDVGELFDLEGTERPLAPLGRALLLETDPAFLYRLFAADSLSIAFGRLRRNTFDRVAHAEWGEGLAAWAMNTAVGYATLAAFLNGPFAADNGTTFIGADAAALRNRYRDWVRGGAILPVIRCGEQPYGLLPITHRTTEQPHATRFDEQFEHQLARLRAVWDDTSPIAALDPDATDSRPDGTEVGDATIVASVLGGVPHPTDLHLRAATNHLPDDTAAFLDLTARLDQDAFGDNLLDPTHSSAVLDAWLAHKESIMGDPHGSPPVLPPDIATQLAHVDLLADELRAAVDDIGGSYPTTAPGMLEHIDTDLRPILQVYQEAIDEVPPTLAEWATRGGLGNGELVNLIGTTFEDGAASATDLITSSGDVSEIRDFVQLVLDQLVVVARDKVPPHERVALLDGPAPLLQHLVHTNYITVPTDDAEAVIAALGALLAMIDSPTVTDPETQLARLTREALGPPMYRLDSWITAIAAERLAERRQKNPAGLQIGSYGWLLDLSPSGDPPSQGFIHAPSLGHAATSAVLRAGWSAYGTASGETPLSINLTSQRVRGAQWILDAVRNGQDLAELLGARFERSLHDARLDDWIETVRTLALDTRGSTRAPYTTVDGLLVARSHTGVDLTTQEDTFRAALLAATAPVADPVEGARRAGVRAAWAGLSGDLDAVADVTMTQAIHSLIQGNDDVANAALAVTGGGDGSVPRIDVVGTQRDAQLVSHRLVAVWSGDGPAPADSDPMTVAEPRLTQWLTEMLPRPADIQAAVEVAGADGSILSLGSISVADIGLTSVEAAFLCANGPTQAASRLGRIVTAHAKAAATELHPDAVATIDTAPPLEGAQASSLDEFGLVAQALTQTLGRSRPLGPADLVAASAGSTEFPGFDVDELTARTAAVEDVLRSLLDALGGNDARRRTALVRCEALAVPGALGALESGATDEAIVSVSAALAARIAPPPPPDADLPLPTERPAPLDTVVGGRSRLRELTGNTVPILPVFTPVIDADRAASASSPQRLRQATTEAPTWLAQSSRVRGDLGPLADFLLFDESLTGRPIGPWGLAQLPHTEGRWAAIARPDDDADRTSILSLTGPENLAVDAAPLTGLFFDGWTEGIPRHSIQTGIAVHFDSPSARPPQALLLSVVDDDRGFSAHDLCDQLLDVIGLAKIRAAGPADLPDIGQYVPAVFLPGQTEISGAPT